MNTIVLNASGSAFNPATPSGFFVKPIATAASASAVYNLMMMNPNTNEILVSTAGALSGNAKTFVIDHPKDINKYLVHACLEGPEAGVYYRGKGEIQNKQFTSILLPDYVDALAYDFTVQITPIYNGLKIQSYNVSEIENNKFQVYGENGKFFWIVHGKRNEVDVEPLKSKTMVKGDGPYRWIHF